MSNVQEPGSIQRVCCDHQPSRYESNVKYKLSVVAKWNAKGMPRCQKKAAGLSICCAIVCDRFLKRYEPNILALPKRNAQWHSTARCERVTGYTHASNEFHRPSLGALCRPVESCALITGVIISNNCVQVPLSLAAAIIKPALVTPGGGQTGLSQPPARP